MKEALAIPLLCSFYGGEIEVRHHYIVDVGPQFIRVDCETDTHVMEMGLDKRSSFDSIHQAVFASIVTGKLPQIVIIDTDLRVGKEEFQIKNVAELLGIPYVQVYLQDVFKMQEMIDDLGLEPAME
jgi:hypothetical protein